VFNGGDGVFEELLSLNLSPASYVQLLLTRKRFHKSIFYSDPISHVESGDLASPQVQFYLASIVL
jgi:hypothetical protein